MEYANSCGLPEGHRIPEEQKKKISRKTGSPAKGKPEAQSKEGLQKSGNLVKYPGDTVKKKYLTPDTISVILTQVMLDGKDCRADDAF